MGAFLWAYNEHKYQHKIGQKILSEITTITAIGLTVFLTTEGRIPATVLSTLHYVFITILFLILIRFYFFSGRCQRVKWQKR
jgi:EamA domain-containing membrane protein RarD